ncbi:E3 binding domain-containing protein [Deinococcus radiotolerans]|uniref:Peripheral subunit-binding (PSBD) domain-containing protein n=1 Tax=Deinococcus radiotolerans TaxID=1309407 RepID=A0ABQ2FPW2_9DEIO|nr:E3 binding domain-containing protein [Deinococcus radiotolerans]GGL14965.1 hypothetical protein GCM10010844_37290 [Deinococcus radiotolerans]
MDRIAPLAKILAEANGIDWQRLQGSGAGGLIVEQDILNYLSRVMSGEEDPPSTPVDLPPPDWNGEEVPTADMLGRAGMSADMLSRAGVDTDLTAFVEQTRAAAPSVPAQPTASLDDDAMEFELEDEPDAAPAPVAATPSFSAPTSEVTAPVTPVAETATPEPVAAPEPTPAPAAGWNWGTPAATPAAAPEAAAHEAPPASPAVVEAPSLSTPEIPTPAQPAAEVAAAEPTPAAAPAAAGGLAAGLGSLLSRLYQKPAETAPAQPEPVSSAAPEPQVTEPVAVPVQAPTEPEPAPQDAPAWSDGRQADDAAWSQPAEPEAAVAEAHEAPAGSTTELPAVEPVTEPEVSEPAAQHVMPEAAPTTEAPEVSEPEAADVVAAETESGQTEPAAAEVTAAEPVAEEPAEQPAAAAIPAAEPEQAPAAVTPAPSGNAVWFGAYLRRDANVAALHDLRDQVTAALERDLPVALLVARAAARHADTLGLSGVAMHTQDGARAAGSGSLRDALDAGAFAGTPDLLVVDAGAMDLDDLHFPHTTTLSVGRVQDGRAALTLNGDVDAARAAQFLAQVAGTLEQPILLVL